MPRGASMMPTPSERVDAGAGAHVRRQDLRVVEQLLHPLERVDRLDQPRVVVVEASSRTMRPKRCRNSSSSASASSACRSGRPRSAARADRRGRCPRGSRSACSTAPSGRSRRATPRRCSSRSPRAATWSATIAPVRLAEAQDAVVELGARPSGPTRPAYIVGTLPKFAISSAKSSSGLLKSSSVRSHDRACRRQLGEGLLARLRRRAARSRRPARSTTGGRAPSPAAR